MNKDVNKEKCSCSDSGSENACDCSQKERPEKQCRCSDKEKKAADRGHSGLDKKTECGCSSVDNVAECLCSGNKVIREKHECCGHEDLKEDCCCNSHDDDKDECCRSHEEHKEKCCCSHESHKDEECRRSRERIEERSFRAHAEEKNTFKSCCAPQTGSKHKEESFSSCCSGHSAPEKKGECAECEVEASGCSCCDLTPHYEAGAKTKRVDRGTAIQLIKLSVSLVFLVLGFFDWHSISGGQGFFMAFYYVNPAWVAVFVCGIPIFIGAFQSLKAKRLTASVLISVAMLASIALEITGFFVNMASYGHNHSYVFAAGEIAFLMALGGLLEDVTVKKCRSGIQRLVGLIPTEANVIREDGGIERVSLSKINVGDRVLVKSGEMVGVDGVILKGSASIDQSSLTGEYLPVDVSEGDGVYGGTMNKNGVIEVEVTKLQKDMTIAKMAELTMEAEGKKSPISRLADKWASYIVPAVFLTSIIVGLVCGLATDIGTLPSIVRAITVLVVFCPCSLVLATPTAIAAGLGNAARNGVLVKSGASLEELSRVDTICFDKTGTITEGKIELQDAIPDGISREELIKIAASAEVYSEHPLALAVLNEANKNELYPARNIETLQGVGIRADIDGKRVSVLSYKKASEQGIELAALERSAEDALSVGKTVVIVAADEKAIGLLAFSDTVRPNAAEVFETINGKGYATVMLTGDNGKSANYIAEQCNVSKVMHSLMPEDKLSAIEDLQKSGHKVAMIGDGINDAPSLKLADCSFAMGAMGSDIAIDTADMAILNSDIGKVNDMLKLSKRVMRTIKRNIILAMTISVAAVILSGFGLLTPVTGALVHNCTSVLVVASSALVLYNRKKKEDKILAAPKKAAARS